MSEFSSEKSQIPVFYFGSYLISTSTMDAVQFASKFGVFYHYFGLVVSTTVYVCS